MTPGEQRESRSPERRFAGLVDLLQLLSAGPVSLVKLYTESKMSFSQLSDVLEILQEIRLVRVSREKGEEIAELTPAGRRLAEPALGLSGA